MVLEGWVQSQSPILVQEQRLKLSPRMYQSIKLMTLPVQELRFRIRQEVEANPALELAEEHTSLSLDELEQAGEDRLPEEMAAYADGSDMGISRGYDDEAGDAKRRFMEGALAQPESLRDHLLWQLRLQPITEEETQVGELLIGNLDENGFHMEDPFTLVSEDRHDQIRHMMTLIQSLEPAGTCTADYRESLRVQARLDPDAPDAVDIILDRYLDLLERGKYHDIAKKLRVRDSEVLAALTYIRRLTPFPGRQYESTSPRYVIPDLLVTIREGQFVVIINEEEIPVLSVNPVFTDILENGADRMQSETRQFVSTRVRDAKWFIHSVHQRNQTLLKVAQALIVFQREFFLRGPRYLAPLTLREIAAEVGVHEATVSRITTSKYAQTEWGIFPLKYFFSNAVSGTGSTGSRLSKEAAKEILRELLESEAGAELSDQALADRLKQQGVNIARRTVAKYRKELHIASSYDR